ncbi:MAG: hypothetical protein M4579_000300 [Chaenotheca gracillima]|nr:MAG: hypothetical protein M4579_000300 [Chaenotheca gracillima]
MHSRAQPFLLTSRDRESGTPYEIYASSEEFLASHVLRIPGTGGVDGGRDVNMRESKGKARQFNTVNGRSVIVKDSFVYSNKETGFKTLNQAQLLNDALWYSDGIDAQQWLIIYISTPLTGSSEPLPSKTASLSTQSRSSVTSEASASSPSAPASPKKAVKTFNDLLNGFPMIARQMQPGLEKIFRRFREGLDKPLPPTPSAPEEHPGFASYADHGHASENVLASSQGEISYSEAPISSPPLWSAFSSQEEDTMREALETAVTAAIDLFQQVDKQQLSLLGATTDLTGPMVERLIERYVTEQMHYPLIFPRLCAIRRGDDQELETNIRQMENIDITQVGIPITDGRLGKHELMLRIAKGVHEFRKLGVAGCPQEMIDSLLATEKLVTVASSDAAQSRSSVDGDNQSLQDLKPNSEKERSVLTINADTLVSLLLVVVIRAQVRHLHARLSYMQRFVFIDDVETGEIGYALSTFEAVLSYLSEDSGGLRAVSRRNKNLWQATKRGDIRSMKRILEPDSGSSAREDNDYDEENETLPMGHQPIHDENTMQGNKALNQANGTADPSGLGHVFPFQTQARTATPPPPSPQQELPRKKRVSMDARSMSSSSQFSFHSRTTTIDSKCSGIEGDMSVERLSSTQDSSGDSVIMMAIANRQLNALKYLLSLREFYPVEAILEDVDNDGNTLLSSAVQLGHPEMIETMLDFVLSVPSDAEIKAYLMKQDSRGRTMAHYLFNAPHIIKRIGKLLPWRTKDKNGQTPLFALCRSYDHPDYRSMIDSGVSAAAECQQKQKALQVDDHVDAKGNTLLHIVSDPQSASMIMFQCDCDVNATNDKRFTPFMVASKYGRLDMVRAFFGDPRIDLFAKELRGFTAVELAKDEEVRNRIDDLVLLCNPPAGDGRITSVVRSFFVEDATIRLVLKSASPATNSTITITTCRRSLADFENLSKWLSVEHPASWMPSISNLRSPFQISTRPSRAVLRDTQVRLDNFLRVLLSHPTFSTHELLWEFFLVPDIHPEMMAERSQKKAEIRLEKVREEVEPVEDIREVELFIGHAREMVRSVHHASRSVLRSVNRIRMVTADLVVAHKLASEALSSIQFISKTHLLAFERYSATLTPPEVPPFATFHSELQSINTTIDAILSALRRPSALIGSMSQTSKAIDRHLLSLRRSDRWPLGLLDETRTRIHREAAEKTNQSQVELATLGSELRYTQQTVAAELAAWQDLHEKMARHALRNLASKMVVIEKARLENMRRAVRELPASGRPLRRK